MGVLSHLLPAFVALSHAFVYDCMFLPVKYLLLALPDLPVRAPLICTCMSKAYPLSPSLPLSSPLSSLPSNVCPPRFGREKPAVPRCPDNFPRPRSPT